MQALVNINYCSGNGLPSVAVVSKPACLSLYSPVTEPTHWERGNVSVGLDMAQIMTLSSRVEMYFSYTNNTAHNREVRAL